MMGMIIDLLSIVILIACFCLGYKKGFIKSIMGLASLVVAIVLAINFYSYPAQYIKDNFIEPYFVNNTSETFSALMNGGTEVIPPEKVFEDEPDALTKLAERFGLEVTAISDYYESTVKKVTDSFDISAVSDKLSEFVVESTVDTISNVLGFLTVLITAIIAINIVLWLLNLIFKLPVLKFANRLAGGVLGIVKAAIIIAIVVNVAIYIVGAITNENAQDSNKSFFNIADIKTSTSYTVLDSAGLIF